MAQGRKTGGRQAGTPNKANADIKAAAAIHGPAALKVLIGIAENEEAPHSSRVAAAVALLDRGYGKPTQAIDASLSGQITLAQALGALNSGAH